MKNLSNFSVTKVQGSAGLLHTLRGGSGSPLLLLHGHPQTHAMWHLVAPVLAKHFTVVMMDLRGCGDSCRPSGDIEHAAYSKRAMALDAAAVMQHYGFKRFGVLAHDRGARVAHRLALDHADRVERMMLLDIAPTLAMYENSTQAFATAYWHWFFLIQPPPLPEALIESDPVRYLRSVMGKRHAGLAAFAPDALAEYERCVQIAGTAHAICEDYRASATIDLVHDRADVASSSLSGLRIVGCKSTAAVYFSPFSYPISRYWDAKTSKTILAGADFRFRRLKPDRLLAKNLSNHFRFCGASMVLLANALMYWRCGVTGRLRCRAAVCSAAITLLKKQQSF